MSTRGNVNPKPRSKNSRHSNDSARPTGRAAAAGRKTSAKRARRARYKSDAFAAIHESAKALHEVGAISAMTMREFDRTCLTTPEPLTAGEIKRLREKNHVSQPVFAAYLNTSESAVAQWESGAKRPGGPALRLLSIVKKRGLQALE